MKIKEVAKRMGKFLNDPNVKYGGDVSFDHKSYDCAEDIPHIFVNGKRRDVLSVEVAPRGNYISLYLAPNGSACVGMFISTNEYETGLTEEELEKELEEMNIYELLQDVYYETSESWEMGDFEMDFLKEE